MNGVVCFSATLSPLPAMKTLLGGQEEDALFSAPSPFPRENLTLYQADVDTRYPQRQASVPGIVRRIEELWRRGPCRCMVFFPSFAYLRLVDEALDIPHQSQQPGMSPQEREDFLIPYRTGDVPVLGLCVLGGVFS